MELKPVDVTTKTVEELKEIWRMKLPMIGIEFVLFHQSEHWDEIVTFCVFKNYGEKIFPECKNIPVASSSNEAIKKIMGQENRDAFWELLSRGFLCFGISGGPLDDHIKGNLEHCAATLLAKFLNVLEKPELRRILAYTKFTDKRGDSIWSDAKNFTNKETDLRNICQSLLPANQVKSMWRVAQKRNWSQEKISEKILGFVSIVEMLIEEQILFKQDKQDVKKSIVIVNISNQSAVAIVDSVIPDAHRLAKSLVKTKRELVLTITANPETGNFYCLTNSQRLKDLENFKRFLVGRVLVKRDLPVSPKMTIGRGENKAVPELFYHPEHESLFNGAKTNQDVPGLYKKILFKEDFEEAIEYGLKAEFHKDHQKECRQGKCAGKSCPLFGFGLKQCLSIGN